MLNVVVEVVANLVGSHPGKTSHALLSSGSVSGAFEKRIKAEDVKLENGLP